MKIIDICPECACPGVEININALENIIKKEKKENISLESHYFICTSPLCNISYFSNENTFTNNDLIHPIWYKDDGMNVPICYCTNLTRGEIIEAVKNGCKTIDDVQKFSKKKIITGKCESKNPIGKCCRNVFLYTMKKK
ncbi:MAG: (2Fe-2S)-binding protein [Candidatus Lokiarchaeota archaeon]|nr:(2Fe-2S)-binding protein [Candidatus Lokiarchaeota archaeon]